MSDEFDRRTLLKGAAAAAAVAIGPIGEAEAAADGLVYGEPTAFSFDLLKARAREMSRLPYAPPPQLDDAQAKSMNYDEMGRVKFRFENAIFRDGPAPFPIEMINVGMFNRQAIRFHVVDHGASREVLYRPGYFDYRPDSPFSKLPKDIGFGGFRIHEAHTDAAAWMKKLPWAVFQGASYFRTAGELGEMGVSARGIALDVAVADRPEEFPDFTAFYVDSASDGETLTVYALLEGPSIVGAYRFLMKRTKCVVMDTDCALFMRASIARFGIAPLTSMYWFSETKKLTAIDWRPEVHDSDGLPMWSGSGERLWRALNNPPRIMVSAFLDNNPHGFGLSQRDRVFDHYQDGVNYDRRPTIWVEPLPGPKGEGWGKGSIQLCEIPTDDEIHDNVVAMWVPEQPVVAGAEMNISYRLHWVADEPYPPKLARCVATRLGRGGQPGLPRPKGVRKFVVEFLGAPLAKLPYGVKPEMVVTASRGSLKGYSIVEAVPDGVPGHWRAEFDLTVDLAPDPVEMRCFLRHDGEVLTETWLFQYHPF